MKRLLIAIAASIWGLIVFRIALGIHFPSDSIQNRIAVEVSKATDDANQLKIGELGLASFLGVQIKDGIWYTKNDQGEFAPNFMIEQASVVLSPIQALLGALSASIEANLLGGEVSATLDGDSFQPNKLDIVFDTTSLDLSQVPVVSPTFEANLAGKLTTHVEGTFPQELPHKNSEGRFTIAIDGLSIANAKASGIELPTLDFSEFSISGLFNNGKLEITDANIISESIGLSIDGDIILGKLWQRSRLRLTLELKLGSEFALIAKMLPALKNNKVTEENGDSIYKIDVIGTIKNPRIKTNNRNRGRQNNRVNRNKVRDIEKGTIENTQDNKTPDEKRRERRERIEARKRAQEKRKEAGGLDLPDRPIRNLPNRPLQRVPELEPEDDDLEPSEEELEPSDEEFDPGAEEEPSDENDDEVEPSDEDE